LLICGKNEKIGRFMVVMEVRDEDWRLLGWLEWWFRLVRVVEEEEKLVRGERRWEKIIMNFV
jgi:hypothetical protein